VDERARNANFVILNLIRRWIGSRAASVAARLKHSVASSRQCNEPAHSEYTMKTVYVLRRYTLQHWVSVVEPRADDRACRGSCWRLRRWWLVGCVAMHVDDKACNDMPDWLYSRACPLQGGCRAWRRVAWRDRTEERSSPRQWSRQRPWKHRTLPSTKKNRLRFVGIEG